MRQAYTAHIDTFARDNLPPRSQWPEFLFELPELKYPARLNCAAELLDKPVTRGHGHRNTNSNTSTNDDNGNPGGTPSSPSGGGGASSSSGDTTPGGSGGNATSSNGNRGSGSVPDHNPFNPSPSHPTLGVGFNNDGASVSIRAPIGGPSHAVTPMPREGLSHPLLTIPFGHQSGDGIPFGH